MFAKVDSALHLDSVDMTGSIIVCGTEAIFVKLQINGDCQRTLNQGKKYQDAHRVNGALSIIMKSILDHRVCTIDQLQSRGSIPIKQVEINGVTT